MKLGSCIDLSVATANVTYSGLVTSAGWASGVFTVEVAEAEDCSEGSIGFASATCALPMLGCGRVRVTIGGAGGSSSPQGCMRFAQPALSVQRDPSPGAPQTKLSMSGPGGGGPEDQCENTGDLVIGTGTNPCEFDVVCGDYIMLNYSEAFRTECPALTITFTVEVVA